MADYQHNLDVEIAETLEKVQHINPELYGYWYSKLYAPHGDTANWNVRTLEELKQLFV
jgi:hypothetical protein